MADGKTNLRFLRGTEASLPTGSNIIDGAFYLTTDSHRLYTGIGNKLIDLNKSITIVEDITALNNVSETTPGSFYYINSLNVLAVYKNVTEDGVTTAKWVQINPDTITTINSDTFSTSTSGTNAVKVESALNITSNAGEGDKTSLGTTTDVEAEFVIQGGTNIEVIPSKTGSGDAEKQNAVSIRANEYSLATTSTGASNVGIKLQTKGSGNASDVTGSTFNINASDNITLTPDVTNKAVSIAATDTKVSDVSVGFTSAGALTVAVTSTTDAGNGGDNDSVTPHIKYGIQNPTTQVYPGDATFDENASTILDVYTKTEVDNKVTQSLGSYNALEYKGEMTAAKKSDVETNGAPIGSYYVVTEKITFTDRSNNEVVWFPGDSVIVTPATNATETDGVVKGNSLVWVYVESGNDDIGRNIDATQHLQVFTQNEKNLFGMQLAVPSTGGNVELTSDGSASTATFKTASGNNTPILKTTISLVWETF